MSIQLTIPAFSSNAMGPVLIASIEVIPLDGSNSSPPEPTLNAPVTDVVAVVPSVFIAMIGLAVVDVAIVHAYWTPDLIVDVADPK